MLRPRTFGLLVLVPTFGLCTAPVHAQKPGGSVVRNIVKGAIAVGAANTLAIAALSLVNAGIESRPSTVVYSAGHAPGWNDRAATAVVDFFMYPPVVLRQNLRGHRVQWHSGATRAEVLDTVRAPNIQSMVFVGHGTRGRFWARDQEVTAFDLYDALWDHRLQEPGTLKTGESIQLTCGNADLEMPIGQGILADPSRSLRFTHVVDPFTNYLGAWRLVAADTL